eukprot:TRINITY_DN1349_c0_g2_i1.p1 TRINITY_DN1349_c0_g2~~TRINITY_DN1349_c0_g2_i1.p1  ORF type:complete len:608 (-),score=139.88 TRINITY_DN1349_c0_g2_i1:327-2150(-)
MEGNKQIESASFIHDSFESVNRPYPISANRSFVTGTKNNSLMESVAEIEPDHIEPKIEAKTKRLLTHTPQPRKKTVPKNAGAKATQKTLPKAKRMNKSTSITRTPVTNTAESAKRTHRLYIDCKAEVLKEHHMMEENLNDVNTTSPSKRGQDSDDGSEISRDPRGPHSPLYESFATFREQILGNKSKQNDLEGGYAQPMPEDPGVGSDLDQKDPLDMTLVVKKSAEENYMETFYDKKITQEEYIELMKTCEFITLGAGDVALDRIEDLPVGAIRHLLDSGKVTRETTLYALAGVFSLCAGLKSVNIVCKDMENVTYNVISINHERVENIERELEEVRRHIDEGLLSVKTIQFIANCLQNYAKVVDNTSEEDSERGIIEYLRSVIENFFVCDPRVKVMKEKYAETPMKVEKAEEMVKARSGTPAKEPRRVQQSKPVVNRPKSHINMAKKKDKKTEKIPKRKLEIKKPEGIRSPVKGLPHSPSFGMPLNFVEVPAVKEKGRSVTPSASMKPLDRKNLHKEKDRPRQSTKGESNSRILSTMPGEGHLNRSLSFNNMSQFEKQMRQSLSPKPRRSINPKLVPIESNTVSACQTPKSRSVDKMIVSIFICMV